MSAINLISPFKDFLKAFKAFLEQQQHNIAAAPNTFPAILGRVNGIYLLNIERTLEKLDHLYRVLQKNPEHPKASFKMFEYAARAKFALKQTQRGAELQYLLQFSEHPITATVIYNHEQCLTLYTQLQLALGAWENNLTLPQKHWLDQDLQKEEFEYHQALFQKLLHANPTPYAKELAQNTVTLESIHRNYLLSYTRTTAITFGALEEEKRLRARL